MTPKNQRRAVTRRARQNKRSGRIPRGIQSTVTTITGRQQVGFVSTNSSSLVPLTSVPLDPLSLGSRLSDFVTSFERYKINFITFRYRALAGSDFIGFLTFGVHDDALVSTVPTSEQQVINYRCSNETAIWKNMSLSYSPVDRNRWFYCNADTVNDLRFTQAATLYYIGSQSVQIAVPNSGAAATFSQVNSYTVGVVDCEYSYSFVGATTIAD